jgi:hypothetical protein
VKKLLKLHKDDLALVLGELANRRIITNQTIKTARMTLPSFSAEKWAHFAKETDGLPSNPSLEALQIWLEPFVIPSYTLPPSFHEAIIESSWRTQDVFQEKILTNYEARVRLLDPVRQHVHNNCAF